MIYNTNFIKALSIDAFDISYHSPQLHKRKWSKHLKAILYHGGKDMDTENRMRGSNHFSEAGSGP